jgi:hypothetical protein
MTSKTVRAVGGAIFAAMVGVMLAGCTTVVHDRTPSVAVVKERERAPDVVVVPD